MIAYILKDFKVHYRSKMCITATQGTSIVDICTTMNPLRYGGRLSAPPFFQKPNSQKQKNLKSQKSEKIPIPPLRSFNFYQNHLVCLQNAFEKTYPESRSPKGSCHI
jgi:hypothetical protein